MSGFSSQTTGQTLSQPSGKPVCHSNTSLERWKLYILVFVARVKMIYPPGDVCQCLSSADTFFTGKCCFILNAGGGQSGTFFFEWRRQTGCFLFLRRRRHYVERRNAGKERQEVQVNHIFLYNIKSWYLSPTGFIVHTLNLNVFSYKPFSTPQVHLPSFFALLGGASGAESSCSVRNARLRNGELRQHLERPGEKLGLEVVAYQCAGKRGVASSGVGGAYPGLLRINKK